MRRTRVIVDGVPWCGAGQVFETPYTDLVMAAKCVAFNLWKAATAQADPCIHTASGRLRVERGDESLEFEFGYDREGWLVRYRDLAPAPQETIS